MNEGMAVAYYESPIGWLRLAGDKKFLSQVDFEDKRPRKISPHPYLDDVIGQLDEYFKGKRKKFDVRLKPTGTQFQQSVWKALRTVKYGRTASYHDIAVKIGKPDANRAVGAANGKNPIAIIIPCHRIIGSNGKLTGYGGGMWRKEWLLEHEQTTK